jgi:hypothetical protein
MFQLALQLGSGRSPQPTNAQSARGEELHGERTFVAGPALYSTFSAYAEVRTHFASADAYRSL